MGCASSKSTDSPDVEAKKQKKPTANNPPKKKSLFVNRNASVLNMNELNALHRNFTTLDFIGVKWELTIIIVQASIPNMKLYILSKVLPQKYEHRSQTTKQTNKTLWNHKLKYLLTSEFDTIEFTVMQAHSFREDTVYGYFRINYEEIVEKGYVIKWMPVLKRLPKRPSLPPMLVSSEEMGKLSSDVLAADVENCMFLRAPSSAVSTHVDDDYDDEEDLEKPHQVSTPSSDHAQVNSAGTSDKVELIISLKPFKRDCIRDDPVILYNTYTGMIKVNVLEGRRLKETDIFGSVDPFTVVTFGSKSWRTATVQNNVNPVWNEEIRSKHLIKLAVYDDDWHVISSKRNDFIGFQFFELGLLKPNTPLDIWLTLGQRCELTDKSTEVIEKMKESQEMQMAKDGFVMILDEPTITQVVATNSDDASTLDKSSSEDPSKQSNWRPVSPITEHKQVVVPVKKGFVACDIIHKPLDALASVVHFTGRLAGKVSRGSALNNPNLGELRIRIEFVTKDEVEKDYLRSIFRKYDDPPTGYMGKSEFAALAVALDLPLKVAMEEFEKIDESASGKLTFEQMFLWLDRLVGPNHPSVIRNLLEYCERGKISVDGEDTSVFEVMTEDCGHEGIEHTIESERHKLFAQDRETGLIVEEFIPSYVKHALNLVYDSMFGGSAAVKIKNLLRSWTFKQGPQMNNPASVKEILPFIDTFNLDSSEFAIPISEYKNFNEFFYRCLKPECRPLAFPEDEKVLVSLADCRLTVFDTVYDATKFWIKGNLFTIKSLIGDSFNAEVFDAGSIAIFRLAPQDYHRFHFPISGRVTRQVDISGDYFTVNPIAVNKINVFTENRRSVCEILSPMFGRVLIISIGATMVGSIKYTSVVGDEVKRGDEHGYFAFGGSTCVVLFQRGKVVFDSDLVANSLKSLETIIKVKTKIGVAK